MGQFGWGGAATTWAIIDPKEDLICLLFTQFMPMSIDMMSRFQTIVYQAIIDGGCWQPPAGKSISGMPHRR